MQRSTSEPMQPKHLRPVDQYSHYQKKPIAFPSPTRFPSRKYYAKIWLELFLDELLLNKSGKIQLFPIHVVKRKSDNSQNSSCLMFQAKYLPKSVHSFWNIMLMVKNLGKVLWVFSDTASRTSFQSLSKFTSGSVTSHKFSYTTHVLIYPVYTRTNKRNDNFFFFECNRLFCAYFLAEAMIVRHFC